MAEKVQAALDRMVAPLADLRDRGVFSPEEIRATVRRRRESEYALARRHPRKADHLRYIRDETDLERLRALRTERMERERQSRSGSREEESNRDEQSKRPGDRHILQHLHSLWTRTLRKYRDDAELYLQYAAFCRERGSWRRLSECHAEAVRYHPSRSELWIDAADSEFWERRRSVAAARVLLQRGIRVNEGNAGVLRDLWLHLFTLELHFVQKLAGRKAVLSGREAEEDADADDRHGIVKVVYDNAIKSAADSVEFRLALLDRCRQFPATSTLETYILESLNEHYGTDPTAWIARAAHEWNKSQRGESDGEDESNDEIEDDDDEGDEGKEEKEEEVSEPQTKKRRTDHKTDRSLARTTRQSDPVEILREACQKIRTEEMFLKAIQFLESCCEDRGQDSAWELIRELFQDAAKSDFYSEAIALRHADFLLGNDEADAVAVLENFASTEKKAGRVSAQIWIRWAGLVSDPQSATGILEQALQAIPMHESDHMKVLLQLFGAKLEEEQGNDLSDLFQRILILAPGFVEMEDVKDPPFAHVKSVPTACLEYLLYRIRSATVKEIRKAYEAVLFQSTLAPSCIARDGDSMKRFVDESIKAEQHDAEPTNRRQLGRLFDAAIELFRGTPLEEEYRQRRNEELLYKRGTGGSLKRQPLLARRTIEIPTFDFSSEDFEPEEFVRAYEDSQAVHLRNVCMPQKGQLVWKDIGAIFESLAAEDKESWTVETNGGASIPPAEILRPELTQLQAYCSFLIQNDKKAYKETTDRLPVKELVGTKWSYENALWIFFGRNPVDGDDLDGRPEHTDCISHDGTWHYQLSGVKQWFLRPTEEVISKICRQSPTVDVSMENRSLRLDVKEGDVLVVNTNLWFHRTIIPPQRFPSVSYARDFRLKALTSKEAVQGGMKNLDGLYATNDIERGTVVFTEIDMPDCELHRSRNPNCEVVELEDGTSAVVSSRNIAAGDFFSVPESSSDEDDDGE